MSAEKAEKTMGTRIKSDKCGFETIPSGDFSVITNKIICCFYGVYNKLGYGFLEKVYEKALLIELQKMGLKAQCQYPISVFYDGEIIGEYFADLFVDETVIVEIKSAKNISVEHEAQLLNYLKATRKKVGLLMNFGPKPEFKRRVF